MSWNLLEIRPADCGLNMAIDRVLSLSNDSLAPGSINLLTQLSLPANQGVQLALVGLAIGNVSVPGTCFFDHNVPDRGFNLTLPAGATIIHHPTGPFWFFGPTNVLNLTTTAATFTSFQMLMAVL